MTPPTTLGRTAFTRVNATNQKLFRVNADIPVEDALEMASQFQQHANQLSFEAAMSDQGERFSWPALYLGEMAKALIDDINEALFASRVDT
ncbi:DUF3077 domain-containing protein [Pseudomonas sp. B14-6]|uniref:DUF3077 domain-containing protein n=1 Tax=Pseudomonas sp. B14-6 TaxID=2738843 RepID=UPI00155E09FB|nr:DUF3077 domain-containing protein [Pseudomonas sp. B14-6]QKG66359.1 DUF3077 domain-containing protein [Pseudomonas sp. B14-6]